MLEETAKLTFSIKQTTKKNSVKKDSHILLLYMYINSSYYSLKLVKELLKQWY